MRIALDDLELDRTQVVYPGAECFPMGDRIEAVGVERLWDRLAPDRSEAQR